MNDERFVHDVVNKSISKLSSKIGEQAADLALAQSQIEILQDRLMFVQKELTELKEKHEPVETEPVETE